MECLEEHKKVDVYAFGITLYEMITRTRAWPPLNGNELTLKIIKGERPMFSKDLIDNALTDKTLPNLVQTASISCNEAPDIRPSFGTIVKWLT